VEKIGEYHEALKIKSQQIMDAVKKQENQLRNTLQ
jgi:hypothetical protein